MSHHHPPEGNGTQTRLGIAFGITAAVVIAQAIGAWVTGSLALLTDTVHALTDAVGLLIALLAAHLARRPPSVWHTWGLRRIEILAALGQATLLLVVCGYATIEGIRRLFAPPSVPATELLVFGALGLAANLIGIAVLSSHRHENLNLRAAFLEVLNDALGSLGVIVAAVIIAFTGFQQADAIAGLFIAALIIPRAATLLRETVGVLMEFTPPGLDLNDVRRHILDVDHVTDVHDVHASTVATGLPTISAHVVVADECFRDGHAIAILQQVRDCVREHFPVSVQHSTFQLETCAFGAQEPSSAVHH